MNKPRVLLFDIEVSPSLGYTWGKWEQNVMAFKAYGSILCFAWKWLDEKTTHVLGLPQMSEKQLLLKLRDLLDEADIVVAHNGRSFDVKMVYGYFVHHHIKPPKPFQIVDTKEVAKRHFRFVSNKLDDLGDYLGIGRKIQTGGIELWLDCMKGVKSAWKKMEAYNAQDVILLEKVYLRLRPYMDNHPNHNVYMDRLTACPNCGANKLQARGHAVTRLTRSQRYQCQSCGAWSKGKPEKLGIEMR